MRIYLQTIGHFKPEELADSLAKADPEDFAEFWFEFNKIVDDKKLNKLAEVMACGVGSNRKICFKRLHSLILFHEERNTRHPSLDADSEVED